MARPPRPLAPHLASALRRAAAEAFGAKGLDDASLNDILGRAGMGKGSFYHRFADKAALHDWVTRLMVEEVLAALQPPDLDTLTKVSFRPELTSMLERFMELTAVRAELANLGLMFHNSAAVSSERTIAGVRAATRDWITAALVRGRAVGAIRADLPADLLTELAIATLTTIDRWVLTAPHDLTARKDAATTAIDALWTLLGAEHHLTEQ